MVGHPKKKPRAGSIGEHVARGGKLPGEEGFDVKAVEADVEKRKAETPQVTAPQPKQQEQTTPQLTDIKGERVEVAQVGISPQEKLIGNWQNVVDVLKIAINPFSEDKIVATSGNKVFNTIAEFVANHPYTTALGLALGGKYFKGKFGASTAPVEEVFSNPSIFKKGGLIARATVRNPVAQKLTGNLLMKSGFSLIAAVYILKSATDSYPFAKFEMAEAMDKLGYARSAARKAGRADLVEIINQFQTELLNPEGWNKFFQNSPWVNVLQTSKENIRTAVFATQIYTLIDEISALGLSPADERIEEQKQREEMFQDSVDLRLEKELIAAQEKSDIIAAGQATNRAEEKAAYEEYGRFLDEQSQKRRKQQIEDNVAIIKLWLEYAKKKQLIYENNRPSNLNFGLI